MSYKALLFCPDEKTAGMVTQVLTELDFVIERAGEPFATVKKLTDEQFDALVVDCENEQNASLLFKGARNSALNHSSLYVAVVEGQAGVAKAFRIGANLVLTKPINVEQSKGTLRVARGLLRKSEPKPVLARPATPTSQVTPMLASPAVVAAPVAPAASAAFAAAAGSAPSAPFSLIEVEKEPALSPEPTEVALLESMADPAGRKTAAMDVNLTPAIKSSAEPIAASTSGHAAAAAPALAPEPRHFGRADEPAAKPALELKSAAPLATQEAIVPEIIFSEPSEVAAPSFSSQADLSQPGGGSKTWLWVVIALLAIAAGGYFVVQRFHLLRLISHSAADSAGEAATLRPRNPAPPAPAASTTPEFSSSINSVAPGTTDSGAATPSASNPPEGLATRETIEVSQPAEAPPSKIMIAPKPIQVKTKPAPAPTGQAPTPPPLSFPGSNASQSAMAGIVSTNTVMPKASIESLRVSQGVSQGLVTKKVAPVYPPSALQLRKQGAVELLATVAKDGSITRVKVLSGDATLAKSAADAVRQWKYRPYLLNGEPVEIETQITIHFKLPN